MICYNNLAPTPEEVHVSASSARNGPQGERRRAPLTARRAPLPPRPPEAPGLRATDGEWMTVGDAAESAGVSPGTVRRWRKAGTVAERPAPGRAGAVEVFVTADHRRGGVTSDAPASTEHGGGPRSELGVLVPLEIHQRSLAELILRLTDTTERAVRAEARVERLEAEIAELRPSSSDSTGTLAASPRRRKKA